MSRTGVMALMVLVAGFVLSAAAVAVAQGNTTDQYDEPGGEPGSPVTLGFRLETGGQPPEDATFFGLYGPPESEFSAIRLTDPDGDDVYTGSVELESDQTYAARVVQGTGIQETQSGTFPGELTTLLKDFCASGCVTLTEDTRLSASKDFDQPSGEEQSERETFTATGVLEDPGSTSYQYGTHEITDTTDGTTYALRTLDGAYQGDPLARYEGERVIVYGTKEPGYPVEGGPELLNVTYLEPAGTRNGAPDEEAGTGATAEAETAAFAAASAAMNDSGDAGGETVSENATFDEAKARALEAAQESGATATEAEAVATAAAEAVTSEAEAAPESEAVAGMTILPDTGGPRADGSWMAGSSTPTWIGGIGILLLIGIGILHRRVLRRPFGNPGSPSREKGRRATGVITPALALISLAVMVLAVAACSPGDSSGESSTNEGATQGRTEQPGATRPETTQAETTQAETTRQETNQAAKQGDESAAVPEDKTLKLTIPKMAEIENDEIPTGKGTNENLFHDYAAVHLEGTGFPWQEQANVFIAGHRLGFPGTSSDRAFYDLNKLQNGDQVLLEDANGKRYEYEVFDRMVVEPKDVYVLKSQEGKNIVSLQTCTLPDYSKRLIVQAELKT